MKVVSWVLVGVMCLLIVAIGNNAFNGKGAIMPIVCIALVIFAAALAPKHKLFVGIFGAVLLGIAAL